MEETAKERILITGATGLVGRSLARALINRGYAINALSRDCHRTDLPGVQCFEWDVSAGTVDAACLEDVTVIVHLAGENIAALPWSNRRKQAIRESRTRSIQLLYDLIKTRQQQGVTAVVSASASGYYSDRGAEWMTEDKAPAKDFLGQSCRDWEQAVAQGGELGLRTVSLRSAAILSNQGGLFPRFAGFVKKGLGIVPGSGRQWMPWIHITDAVEAYIYAMEHSGLRGVYNLSAPEPATFADFVRTLAEVQRRPLWLPHIPRFVLKGVLGQMSEMLLSSTRMSAEKIQHAGFRFRYPNIRSAIEALIPAP